jgi:uncharacterized protein
MSTRLAPAGTIPRGLAALLCAAIAGAAACGAGAANTVATAPAAPAPAEAAPAAFAYDIDEALVHADAPLARPFFYVATRGDRRIHLLGTVHLGIDPSRLPPVVWDALDASPIFAMEADLHDAAALTSSLRADGTTLDQELGPVYWRRLQDVVGEAIAAALRTTKTSVVTAFVSMRGMPMTKGMDGELRQRAEARGAHLAFFETVAFQLDLLDRWLDVRALKAQLDDPDGNQKLQLMMLTAYARGDDGALARLATDAASWGDTGRTLDELDRMNREMLVDRNAAWIAPMEQLAAEGPLFAAVGAAHLFEAGGVLELLTARGWTVERVEP